MSHISTTVLFHDAKNDSVEAKLEVSVLKIEKLLLNFYVVSDTAGHSTVTITCAHIPQILKDANAYMHFQAGLSLISAGCFKETINKNLGQSIDSTQGFNEFSRITEAGAQFHVFFVWDYHKTSNPASGATATTKNNLCIFKYHPGASLGKYLAHEVGHFLGLRHVDTLDNLMQEDASGDSLSKAQSLAANSRVRRGIPVQSPISFGPFP